MALYGYKFVLDGQLVCYVSMEYDVAEPRGCALIDDWGINTQADLVDAWLGSSTIDEYDDCEWMRKLARIAGINTDADNDYSD